MAPKRSHHADTKPQPKAPPSDRRILITAGEGQTGRLVIDLLATDKTYLSKYAKLSALVFSQEAKSILAEYENVEVIVYEPDNEQTLIQAMKAIDTCMLIPPSRKVGKGLISLPRHLNISYFICSIYSRIKPRSLAH